MKVEYLNNISEGGKYRQVVSDNLIRLYDFEPEQARQLQDILRKTIIEERRSLDLSSLEFIRPVNCNLVFQIAHVDEVITTTDNFNFVCSLAVEDYEQMIANIEPFCKPGTDGYQWLHESYGTIDLLLSPGGTW